MEIDDFANLVNDAGWTYELWVVLNEYFGELSTHPADGSVSPHADLYADVEALHDALREHLVAQDILEPLDDPLPI